MLLKRLYLFSPNVDSWDTFVKFVRHSLFAYKCKIHIYLHYHEMTLGLH